MQVQVAGPFAQTSTLAVMTFTGVASTLVGAASATTSSTNGAPAAALTTTRDGSIVIGIGTDFGGVRTMTPGAGQAIVYQANPAGGGTYWVQRAGTGGVAGSTVTISDTYTAPMADPWNLLLLEIRRP